MTGETPAGAVVGACACCGEPVHRGEERTETVHVGTGAAPDVLLHEQPCRPRTEVRRWS